MPKYWFSVSPHSVLNSFLAQEIWFLSFERRGQVRCCPITQNSSSQLSHGLKGFLERDFPFGGCHIASPMDMVLLKRRVMHRTRYFCIAFSKLAGCTKAGYKPGLTLLVEFAIADFQDGSKVS